MAPPSATSTSARPLQRRLHRRLQVREDLAVQPGGQQVPRASRRHHGVHLRRHARHAAERKEAETSSSDIKVRSPGGQGRSYPRSPSEEPGSHAGPRGGHPHRLDPQRAGLPGRDDLGGDGDPHAYPEYLNSQLQHPDLPDGPEPVPRRVFNRVDSPEMREKILHDPDPCIVLATAGMMNGGPILEYVKNWADDPNTLVFVGYQAEGTGRPEDPEGRQEIPMTEKGKTAIMKIALEVTTVDGFSGSLRPETAHGIRQAHGPEAGTDHHRTTATSTSASIWPAPSTRSLSWRPGPR